MTPMAIGFMGTYYVVRGDDEGSVYVKVESMGVSVTTESRL